MPWKNELPMKQEQGFINLAQCVTHILNPDPLRLLRDDGNWWRSVYEKEDGKLA